MYYYLVSYQVVRKDKQQGDEEENKSANGPTGSSMDNSDMRQTKEQDKVEDDDEFDQVDAAPMINQPTPLRIVQLQDSHKDQPAVEEHKRTNSEVPKIEVTQTSTKSNSSSDENSAASEERNMKQTGKGEQDDDDEKDELKHEVKKLTSENETLKNTIKNLERDKSSLEENLQEERSKIEVREGTIKL